jgi:hypothetical protein
MYEYQKLAKRYGVSVEFMNTLQLLSTPTQCPLTVDVGFGVGESNVFVDWFPPFRREKFGPGLYVYGSHATTLAKLLPNDERLCATLKMILVYYAYAVEWSGQKLTARINLLQGYPARDGTGGQRLLSAFSEIAQDVSRIDPQQLEALGTHRKRWGPRRIRKLAVAAGAALPVVVVVAIVTYFSLHPAHPFIH